MRAPKIKTWERRNVDRTHLRIVSYRRGTYGGWSGTDFLGPLDGPPRELVVTNAPPLADKAAAMTWLDEVYRDDVIDWED